MASSVSQNTVRNADQRTVLAGGAAAFFVLAVVALIIGQAFVAVLALLCTFGLVMAAAFGRRVLPGGRHADADGADDDAD